MVVGQKMLGNFSTEILIRKIAQTVARILLKLMQQATKIVQIVDIQLSTKSAEVVERWVEHTMSPMQQRVLGKHGGNWQN